VPELTPPPYDGSDESFQAILAWLDASASELDARWAADFARGLVTDDIRRQMAEAVDELRALELPARRATEKARGALAMAEVVACRICEAVSGRQAVAPHNLEDVALEHFFESSGAAAVADWCRRLADPLNELV
jgi:hypothetical protein